MPILTPNQAPLFRPPFSGTQFSNHTKARPVEAAVKATTKAINLALKYNKNHLYVNNLKLEIGKLTQANMGII